MWNIFLSFVLVYFQLLLGGTLFLLKAPRRRRFALRAAASVTVSAGSVILLAYLMSTLGSSLLVMFSFMFLWFLSGATCFVCWDISAVNVLFVSTGCYALQHIGYALFIILEHLCIMNAAASTVLGYLFPFLPAAASYFVLIRRNERVYNSADIKQVFIAFIILIVSIVLSALKNVCENDVIILMIYDLICCLCCLFIQFSISHNELDKQDKKMLETILSEGNKQHELSKQAIAMLNIKFHDIKNKLENLQKLIEDGGDKDLREIKRAVQIYSSMANTGNSTLDAILMEKGLLCEMNKVKFSYVADGSLISFMAAVDIFTLFNNILDNAIESVIKEEDLDRRIVSMRIIRRGDAVLASVENYCKDRVILSDGLPKTTKHDKSSHGIGFKSIKLVVDKYKGVLDFSQDEDTVRVNVLFNL